LQPLNNDFRTRAGKRRLRQGMSSGRRLNYFDYVTFAPLREAAGVSAQD
jgi:hypothetical protein